MLLVFGIMGNLVMLVLFKYTPYFHYMAEIFMSNHWKNSLSSGYSKVRVIGEMSPTIQCIKGGYRLTEYECRITIMLRDNKITCICQYDARKFDGATIMDILLVHPMMIVRGQVVQNPFFVPPEEFLEKLKRQQAAV